MTFIATLISLIIERFLHWSHLRQWTWFSKYQRFFGRYIANLPSWLILFILILPLAAIVGIIHFLLDGWFYSIPQLIFDIIILVYCMGPSNLWVQTFGCITDLNKEDPQIAIDRARADFNVAQNANSQVFHAALTHAIFLEAHTRIFAVVFWFVLLGPVGAVIYRAVSLAGSQSDLGLISVATKTQKILDWLPARVFTLIFALAGHFVEVLAIWKKDAPTNINANDKLIAECGLAALDVKTDNEIPEDGSAEKEALELLDRVFILGLLILAMVVIMLK